MKLEKAKEFAAENFRVRYDTYVKYCIEQVTVEGMWLEFGVCSGATSREIIKLMPPHQALYGFDWFKGLPEDWDVGNNVHVKGTIFDGQYDTPPKIERLEIINGLFEDTLPNFIKNKESKVAFLHVDCDLYGSTKTIFKYLKNHITPGTIIIFDEIYNYPNYEDHEYKAFMEYVEEHNIKFEWIARVSGDGQQAACRIL
jgi:hypothetical protein